MNFLTDPYITVIFGGVVSVAAPVASRNTEEDCKRERTRAVSKPQNKDP